MRISRIYTELSLAPGRVVDVDERAGHYLRQVLKLKPGDPVFLFNGDGFDYGGLMQEARRRRVAVRITGKVPGVPEPLLKIALVQAVGKGDRMDYSVQKATELGVSAVQPLFSERTEVQLDGERLDRRMEHWRGIMIATCEQCGRAVVPILCPPLKLAEWLEGGMRPSVQSILLQPGAERSLTAIEPGGDSVNVIIGPEGGFTELELERFQEAEIQVASLGPRVLRTESAGPAAIAILQALHGDI